MVITYVHAAFTLLAQPKPNVHSLTPDLRPSFTALKQIHKPPPPPGLQHSPTGADAQQYSAHAPGGSMRLTNVH